MAQFKKILLQFYLYSYHVMCHIAPCHDFAVHTVNYNNSSNVRCGVTSSSKLGLPTSGVYSAPLRPGECESIRQGKVFLCGNIFVKHKQVTLNKTQDA